MSLVKRFSICALSIAAIVAACNKDSKELVAPRAKNQLPDAPSMTMGTGTSSTLVGRASFIDPTDETFNVKRKTGDWQIEVKAKPAFDIAVQTIVFAAGGQSGWHRHPGPVFIQVVSGTMTFYESDDPTCTPIVRTAGQGYVDVGERAHIARNESGSPATNVVTYFAPVGAALKIDAPNPGNCPF